MNNISDYTGRFEVDTDQFAQMLEGQSPENIQQFDLKTAFPEELANRKYLPPTAERLWRMVLDEAIAEFGGVYTPAPNSTFVQIWFENIPPIAARAKLPNIAQKIKIMFSRVREAKDNGEAVLKEMFAPAKAKEARVSGVSAELTHLMRHGLTPNPLPTMLDLWITRTTMSMIHNHERTIFDKEIMDAVNKANFLFSPVWLPANELLIGSFAGLKTPSDMAPATPPELMRQELLSLFFTCFQLTVLASKGIKPMGFISLRASTLGNKAIMELINVFLHRLSADVCKNLMIEVRAIPSEGLSISATKTIEALGQFAKAFLFETGPFSKEDYKNYIPKLHACGFDVSQVQLPVGDIVNLIGKFAEKYEGRPQKTYLRGINNVRFIKAGRDCGYTYLTGPAVHPQERICTGVRQYSIRLD